MLTFIVQVDCVAPESFRTVRNSAINHKEENEDKFIKNNKRAHQYILVFKPNVVVLSTECVLSNAYT